MIREALTERLPPPFKDIDPIHYFGTNQIESQSDFVEFVLSLLMEKDFFRRRDNPDRPIDAIGDYDMKIYLISGVKNSSMHGIHYDEFSSIFKKAKSIFQQAFPHLRTPPWNSSLKNDGTDDIWISVTQTVRHGTALRIKCNNVEKTLPQCYMMEKSNREFNSLRRSIKQETNEVTESVIEEMIPSIEGIDSALTKKIEDLDKQISSLVNRKRDLISLKNSIHLKTRKEEAFLKDNVYDLCEQQRVFDSIHQAESERDSEVASWCLL